MWEGVELMTLLPEGSEQTSLHIHFVPHLSNVWPYMNTWSFENWAYSGHSYNSTSTDGFPMRLVPRCQLLMAAKGNQAVPRDAAGHPVLPGLGISLGQEAQSWHKTSWVFFCHGSELMLSQHVNSSQEMLIRMPGECFHHKWLIRVQYHVCLYMATRGSNQRQSTKTLKRQGGGKGIYQQSWQKLVMLWALSHTFIPF